MTKIFSNIEVFVMMLFISFRSMFPNGYRDLPTFVNAEAIHISVKNLSKLLPE